MAVRPFFLVSIVIFFYYTTERDEFQTFFVKKSKKTELFLAKRGYEERGLSEMYKNSIPNAKNSVHLHKIL
jgi:hypothetical protein